jgi:voltage-gated potassium channel
VTIDAGGRRAILGTVLLSAVSVCLMVAAYYAAPLDRPLNRGTGLLLGAALLLFAVLVAVQVRGILRSRRPRLRAIQALIMGVPLLIVVFAATYCTVDAQQPGAFSESLSRTDGLYFTVTVFATVGFGDISPVTQLARVLVTLQMVVGLLTVGVIAKVVFGAVQVAETRQSQQSALTGLPGD